MTQKLNPPPPTVMRCPPRNFDKILVMPRLVRTRGDNCVLLSVLSWTLECELAFIAMLFLWVLVWLEY